MPAHAPLKTVYEDEHLLVLHRRGSTPHTLATFSIFNFYRPGTRIFWFRTACDRADLTALGFVAKANNWFPACSMVHALRAAQPLLAAPVIGLGFSHGGYGVLKYARDLGAAAVISFAPQFSINPASLEIAPTYRPLFNPDLHAGMDITKDDLSGRVVLIYDLLYKRDLKHVERIRALGHQPTELVLLHDLGHAMNDVLAHEDVTMALIAACAAGDTLDGVRQRFRRIKRDSPYYAVNLANHLTDRHRPKLAVRVLQRVLDRNAGPLLPRDEARFQRAWERAGGELV